MTSSAPPSPAAQGAKLGAWFSLRGALYLALGLLSSALFLYLALSRLALAEVQAALLSATLWPWLPLAVLCYLLGHGLRGLRCRRLASTEATLSVGTATNVVVLGYAVNNILPARLGEFARAGMLAERTGLPYVQGLSLTFLERILDGLVMLGLLALAYASLPTSAEQGWLGTSLRLAFLLFGGAVVGVLCAVLAPSLLLRWASRLTQSFSPRIHETVVRGVDHAVRGVAYLRSPRAALGVLGLSLLIWLCESGLFLCLLPAFGLSLDLRVALLAMTVTNLGILLPSSPGFIGPFHYFCMRALGAVGVGEVVAFSYAALVHLAFYIPITLWGVGILFAYGFSLSRAARDQRRAESAGLFEGRFRAPVEQADRAASPTTRALCEALLPADELPTATRDEVVQVTADFVEGQLAALPLRLRILFSVGMLGFRAATCLRFLRNLAAVPIEARRRWVSRFAYGKLGLLRQLFRAPRTTALVAYYEHPAVRQSLQSGEPEPLTEAQNTATAELVVLRTARGQSG